MYITDVYTYLPNLLIYTHTHTHNLWKPFMGVVGLGDSSHITLSLSFPYPFPPPLPSMLPTTPGDVFFVIYFL